MAAQDQIIGDLQVWRCPNCGRILAEVDIGEGTVRIKCWSCNQFSTLQVLTQPTKSAIE